MFSFLTAFDERKAPLPYYYRQAMAERRQRERDGIDARARSHQHAADVEASACASDARRLRYSLRYAHASLGPSSNATSTVGDDFARSPTTALSSSSSSSRRRSSTASDLSSTGRVGVDAPGRERAHSQQQQKQRQQQQQQQQQRQRQVHASFGDQSHVYETFPGDPTRSQHHPLCPCSRDPNAQCARTTGDAASAMLPCRQYQPEAPSPAPRLCHMKQQSAASATPAASPPARRVPVYASPPVDMDSASAHAVWAPSTAAAARSSNVAAVAANTAATAWRLHVATAQTRGYRPSMEDVFVEHRSDDGSVYVLGVCDGHGGSTVADWLRERLGPIVVDAVRATGDVRAAFAEAQQALERQFDRCALENTGSTACVAIVLPLEAVYYVANCGDSRALLVDLDEPARVQRVSADHKPGTPDESHRIAAAGGFVASVDGVERVGGTLSVSRAFGDNALRPWGVTEAPDVYGPFAFDQATALVLACDGVFDVLSDDTVAAVVGRYVRARAARPECTMVRCAAEQVRNCAFAAQSRDNISVMVVHAVRT